MNGFGKGTLVGNWYEERLAVAQPYREQPDLKITRPDEEALSFAGNDGNLHQLGKMNRRLPWVSKSVIPDDRFSEYKTVHASDFNLNRIQNFYGLNDQRSIVKVNSSAVLKPEGDAQIQTSAVKHYSLLNPQNLTKMTEANRNVTMNNSDFGSTLKKHDREHERTYMITTNHDAFSRPLKQTASEIIKKHAESTLKPAGYITPLERFSGAALRSSLTGETLRTSFDPQHNTRVQRSWLPAKDKAIDVAEMNVAKNVEINTTGGKTSGDPMENYRRNMTQKKDWDIATSLPMGDGQYNLQDKFWDAGTFRKIRTDVTLTRNKPITKK